MTTNKYDYNLRKLFEKNNNKHSTVFYSRVAVNMKLIKEKNENEKK